VPHNASLRSQGRYQSARHEQQVERRLDAGRDHFGGGQPGVHHSAQLVQALTDPRNEFPIQRSGSIHVEHQIPQSEWAVGGNDGFKQGVS